MGIIDELNGNERDRWDGPQRGRRRGGNSNRGEKDDPRHGHHDEDESESGCSCSAAITRWLDSKTLMEEPLTLG